MSIALGTVGCIQAFFESIVLLKGSEHELASQILKCPGIGSSPWAREIACIALMQTQILLARNAADMQIML